MSLNPFTARREKKEEQMKERLHELQSYEQEAQQQRLPPHFSIQPAEEEDRYATEDLDKYLPAGAKSEQTPAFSYDSGGSYEQPSRARKCLAKLQSGFMIGGALGGAFGFLYGTYAAVVYKHILYLPIAVVQAGGAFGFFLACGTVIRCEETLSSERLPKCEPLSVSAMVRPRAEVAVRATDPCYCAVVSAVLGHSQQ
ncbi:hypothetical protein AB1Y20_012756 [Prymnesium parvum]|uniref:Reactive oxygen species modulator 1 n=1 Tax=Prymnesium parvum TaxID=97485 RepID=A0AB34ILE9_PRYPA